MDGIPRIKCYQKNSRIGVEQRDHHIRALTCNGTLHHVVRSCVGNLTGREGHLFERAHGVVVSHPLRMRKALGSNPSVSILTICAL